MTILFYPDQLWTSKAEPYYEDGLYYYTHNDYGYWTTPGYEGQINGSSLDNITDDDTSTKMTCYNLRDPAGDNHFWSYWLEMRSTNPQYCDGIIMKYTPDDWFGSRPAGERVTRIQVVLRPSNEIAYDGATVCWSTAGSQVVPNEHIVTFIRQQVSSIDIRYEQTLNSNNWNVFLYTVGFHPASSNIRDRVMGQTIRVGVNHFSNELILGGLGARWTPAALTRPEPTVIQDLPEGEAKLIREITDQGFRFYWLMPDGSRRYIET